MNQNLENRIQKNLEEVWKKEKFHKSKEEKKIISKLSNKIKSDLFMELYGNYLKNMGFFQFLSDSSFKKVILSGKEIDFFNKELILNVLQII